MREIIKSVFICLGACAAAVLLALVMNSLLGPSAWGAELTYGDRVGAKYLSCYDGDTCAFDLPGADPLIGKHITVRVRGIDTPELHGKCQAEKDAAKKARAITIGLLKKAKKITLKNTGRDKYFRILADIDADGKDVASALMAAGLAVKYDGGTKVPFCK